MSDASLEPQSITVLLGNRQPMHTYDVVQDEEIVKQLRPADHLEQSVTRMTLWPGIDDPELVEHTLSTDNDRLLVLLARVLGDEHRRYAIAVSEVSQMFDHHAGGSTPAWVASTDPELANALGLFYRCPVTPIEVVDGAEIAGPTALLTNGGRDALHAQHLSTSAQPASFNYMAITTDATAAAAGDTTLASEETTNGLARAQASYAHTAGTNTSTLTKTFTYTGSTSKVIAKLGVFNASSAGTMGYETLLSSTATLNVSGDNVTITWTDTAG